MAKAAPKSTLHIVDTPHAAIISDYRVAYVSRQASLAGRREVMSGKAKFGIFGDGKEVAQIAMAKAFEKGDWRAGYYRDQTFMMAIGELTVKQFFAQLYADTDLEHEPASAGRQMNSHFSTRYIREDGSWTNQAKSYNSSSDLSPTAAQMAKLVGLGYASKIYRQNKLLDGNELFSNKGNEVAFGTIGNASAAEGIFWESLNACGVLQVPVAISVWDDGYGISVPNKYQMTKESVSEIIKGYQYEKGKGGVDIYVVKGWDYPALVEAYARGIERVRKEHIPALFHIIDLTQPQGHSTSGSHERYKSAERMAFEETEDCLRKMKEWMIETGVSTEKNLEAIEAESLAEVERQKDEAWREYLQPLEDDRKKLVAVFECMKSDLQKQDVIDTAINSLKRAPTLMRRVVAASARQTLMKLRDEPKKVRKALVEFIDEYQKVNQSRYSKWFMSETDRSALNVKPVKSIYSDKPEMIPGNEVIQRCFDHLMGTDPRLFIIGEDVGVLGDVNQNFKGLQEKYGEIRITDTGIREATILGQGIGAAIRGLRPVVDIQYLDYLLYCFQLLSDDLATLHYRSAGGQIAPVIVRTKGHRLEGIWHSGSPMGMIINGIRGMHVCVPRNMVQAVGFYNTLFASDEPALVIEVLNGYRVKEAVPTNLKDFKLELGVPEVLIEGSDITVVTYGACVRVAEDAAKFLKQFDIDVELVDVQTLLPFDRYNIIGASVEKTNAVLFFDEDVPGGCAAYMMQKVLEEQNVYEYLDAAPRTLTAKPHRSAYASDGDYWSKPSAEDLVEIIYEMMRERNPGKYPPVR